jgi:hypothetical protein
MEDYHEDELPCRRFLISVNRSSCSAVVFDGKALAFRTSCRVAAPGNEIGVAFIFLDHVDRESGDPFLPQCHSPLFSRVIPAAPAFGCCCQLRRSYVSSLDVMCTDTSLGYGRGCVGEVDSSVYTLFAVEIFR